MAILFRVARMKALGTATLGRYLAFAAGEILLIFLGITLALLFNNWNEERNLRRAELSSLNEITANLRANVEEFDENIALDENSLSDCEVIVELIETRRPWSTEDSAIMYNCRTWTSPYLQDAAYESLRLRGTDLIQNNDVKSSIVNLYENEYEQLYGDIDWSQKTFEEAVWGPIYARYFEHRSEKTVKPSDYASFVDSSEFRNALLRHMLLLEVSMQAQADTLKQTQNTLVLVEGEISRITQN